MNIDKYQNQYEIDRLNIIDMLIPPGAYKSLDIGCGTGFITEKLYNKGHTAIGIDVGLDNIAYAKQKYDHIDRMSFKNCSVEELKNNFKNEQFDFIVAAEIIEHLSNYEQLLELIQQLLKVGGTAIITAPNRYSIESLIGSYWAWRTGQKYTAWDSTHSHFFSSFELINLLKRNKFSIRNIVGYYYDSADILPLIKRKVKAPFRASRFFPINMFGFNIITYLVKEN